MTSAAQNTHRTLPPERFYWALLDASALPARPSREQLGYLFETFLPCPIEQVHAVFAKLPSQRFVACGMRRESLAEGTDGAITLAPGALPAFIEDEIEAAGSEVPFAGPDGLNLLIGEFEPPPIARRRKSWLSQAAVILIACSALLTIGLEIRARDVAAHSAELHLARTAVCDHVLGPADASASAHQASPELRMLAELRQLRQTRARPLPAQAREMEDVSLALAQLLAVWPDDDAAIHLQTEHVSVTPSAITLRGLLPSSADAQRAAERFGRVDGWQLQQPQVTTARENVQAMLRFVPQEEPPR